ncbi:hypothetical protein [Rhodanobacter hydrolyticus]
MHDPGRRLRETTHHRAQGQTNEQQQQGTHRLGFAGTSTALDGIPPNTGRPSYKALACENKPSPHHHACIMNSKPYDFRQFQAELSALDQGKPEPKAEPKAEPKPEAKPEPKAKPLGKKAAEAARVARAREEFLALRERYQLSVGDVVAFFPEEEGIAYLQQLLVASERKPRKRKNAST